MKSTVNEKNAQALNWLGSILSMLSIKLTSLAELPQLLSSKLAGVNEAMGLGRNQIALIWFARFHVLKSHTAKMTSHGARYARWGQVVVQKGLDVLSTILNDVDIKTVDALRSAGAYRDGKLFSADIWVDNVDVYHERADAVVGLWGNATLSKYLRAVLDPENAIKATIARVNEFATENPSFIVSGFLTDLQAARLGVLDFDASLSLRARLDLQPVADVIRSIKATSDAMRTHLKAKTSVEQDAQKLIDGIGFSVEELAQVQAQVAQVA